MNGETFVTIPESFLPESSQHHRSLVAACVLDLWESGVSIERLASASHAGVSAVNALISANTRDAGDDYDDRQ
jgi:hypothetical protein